MNRKKGHKRNGKDRSVSRETDGKIQKSETDDHDPNTAEGNGQDDTKDIGLLEDALDGKMDGRVDRTRMAFRIWETDPKKKTLSVIVFQIVSLFVISGLFYFAFYLYMDWEMFWDFGGGSVIYFFPPAGKETVVPGMVSQGVPPHWVVVNIVFIDMVVSLFLIWNFDYVKRVPLFGDLLRFVERKAQAYLKEKTFAKGMIYVMLVLFVMVPFQGSGGAGATIIGRLIGMKPYRIWACVFVGALIGVGSLAYISEKFTDVFGKKNMLIGVVMIFVVAGVYALVSHLRSRRIREST